MARFSLTDLREFLSVDIAARYWIGIDVHKRTYHIALLRNEDDIFHWTVPANNDCTVEQLLSLGIKIESVCYESGPTGFSLARQLQNAGIPVIVAAPSKVLRSVTMGAKTDRLDCIKLARLVSKGLVKSIAIPTPEAEIERALLRRRHKIVDDIRRRRQRIKAMSLFHGFNLPDEVDRWRSGCIEALKSMDLPEVLKWTLDSHVRELEFLERELSILAAQLKSISRNQEHRKITEALESVPGVGEVVATTFLLEVFNPERFKRKEEIAGYLGLAPMVRQSGEKTPQGHLVPVGQTRLRSLLIEAAWIWLSRDENARNLYNKIYSRTMIPQKAITALARKLSIILWRLSIEQRAYRPLLS